MKSKNEKSVQTNTNPELYEVLALIEKEKGISAEYMITQIKRAIRLACKKTYNSSDDDILINMDAETGVFEVFLNKEVVEEVENPKNEIHLDEARKINALARVGDKIGIRLDTKEFGRIAAQKAKNIIRQGIRDSEKRQALAEYQSKLQDIVTVNVEHIERNEEGQVGDITVRLGKSAAILPKKEQVPGEVINENDRIKVYVVDIKNEGKEPHAIISRTHPGFVKKLFETEVPEIFDGTIEIKYISREAGSRTKIAVYSKDENVDAVGACIGPKGQRVSTIVEALNGEKIDIVEYSDDPVKFISAALSPAEVISVKVNEGEKTSTAVVPDSQLSLAIGKSGQNVRLAAKLTGWKIDINPQSGFYGEDKAEEKAEEPVEESAEE